MIPLNSSNNLSNKDIDENVSAFRECFVHRKDLTAIENKALELLQLCRNICNSLHAPQSSGIPSEVDVVDELAAHHKLLENIRKFLNSDLRARVENLYNRSTTCLDDNQFFEQYFSDVKTNVLVQSSIALGRIQQALTDLSLFENLISSKIKNLESLMETICKHISLAESLNQTSHTGKLVLREHENSVANDSNSSDSSDTSHPALSSREEEYSNSEHVLPQPNPNDGSTTKHTTAQTKLVDQCYSIELQNLEEIDKLIDETESKLANLEDIDIQQFKELSLDLESQVTEVAKQSLEERTALAEQLKKYVIKRKEILQRLNTIKDAEKKRQAADTRTTVKKPQERKPYGDTLEFGYNSSGCKVSCNDEGYSICFNGTFKIKSNWVYKLYASINKKLKLQVVANQDSSESLSGTILTTENIHEIYAANYQINLQIPVELKNKQWYGSYSEHLPFPEEFLPITFRGWHSIGAFLYYTTMNMVGVTPYALRNYQSRFSEISQDVAKEGHSTYSNCLAVVNELILEPTIESLIFIIRSSVSVNIYVDETVAIVNAFKGKGHLSQDAANKWMQGLYKDIPNTQYAMVLRCECMQEDGSVIPIVLFQHIGGRSADCINKFVLDVIAPTQDGQCKVNFIFSDAYQVYEKLSAKLNCEWGKCLIHGYRLFIECYNGHFKLVKQLHYAKTKEEKAILQKKIDNSLSFDEIRVGINIMYLLQTILYLDGNVVDMVNEHFSEQERCSAAYLEALRQKRKECRENIIAPYFDTIKDYFIKYFGHLYSKEQACEDNGNSSSSVSMLKLLNKAVSYFIRNWEGLTKFVSNESMANNNNACEQLVKSATGCKKIRNLDFQSEAEVIHNLNLQSVWLTLEACNADQFKFFTRFNHISVMSMVALYVRSRVAVDKKPSKRALDACKFKQDVVKNVFYEELVRIFLTTKDIPLDMVYRHISMVSTTPFHKDEGIKLDLLNEVKYKKRQALINPK